MDEMDGVDEPTQPTETIPQEEGAEAHALVAQTSPPVFRFDTGIDTAQVWISAFLIVAVGIAAYSNLFSIPFHVDAQRIICDNTALQHFSTFPDALDKHLPRTLTMLTFAVNQWLTPNMPVGFHVVDLLLHLTNGVLVFFLAMRLLGPGTRPAIAMLGGMLFVLSPFNTDAVNSIVGRPALLSTCLVLMSILLFLKATRREGPVELGLIAGSLFCFVLAWGAEESALILPLLVLVVDMADAGWKDFSRRYGCHAAYWAMLTLLLAARWADSGLALGVPDGLTPLHSISGIRMPFDLFFVPIALVPVILLVSAGFRKGSLGVIAVSWFAFVTLLMRVMHGVVSEQNICLPLAGLVLVVPWVFASLPNPFIRAVAGIVAAALIIASGVATYTRNTVWRDAVSFWTNETQAKPDWPVAAANLGHAYLTVAEASGESPAALEPARLAEEQLRKALTLDLRNARAAGDLAEAVLLQGRTDDAASLFLDALRLDSEDASSTLHLAILYADRVAQNRQHEDLVRVIDYFKRADELKPLSGSPLEQYGMMLMQLGDLEAAEPVLDRAVARDDASPLAPTLKGLRATLKQAKAMEPQALALLSVNPKDPNGLKMRAQILALRGQYGQALYALDTLLRLNRQDFGAWMLMGCVMAKTSGTDQFLKEWPAPPPKPAEATSAWTELARTCAMAGVWDAAAAYLQSPAALAEDGPPPLVTLAEIALQLRQPRKAYDYLQKAAEADAKSPLPWLRLCDLALAGKDTASASQYVTEAETRGADPAELAKRKERIGGAGTKPPSGVTTIIR